MKAFKFKLDRYLEWCKHNENEIARKYNDHINQMNQHGNQLQEISSQIIVLQNFIGSRDGAQTGLEMSMTGLRVDRIIRQRDQLKKKVVELVQEKVRLKKSLDEAYKRRKVIERIRDRQFEAYKQGVRKDETTAHDEFSARAFSKKADSSI